MSSLETAQADCYITNPTELQAFRGIGQEIRSCVESVRAARVLPLESPLASRVQPLEREDIEDQTS